MKCTRLNALFTSKVGFKPMNFSEIIPFCPSEVLSGDRLQNSNAL